MKIAYIYFYVIYWWQKFYYYSNMEIIIQVSLYLGLSTGRVEKKSQLESTKSMDKPEPMNPSSGLCLGRVGGFEIFFPLSSSYSVFQGTVEMYSGGRMWQKCKYLLELRREKRRETLYWKMYRSQLTRKQGRQEEMTPEI